MKSEQIDQTIAISGATGFVGSFLLDELLNRTNYKVIALSREQKISHHPRLEWRKADFFSLLDLEIALKGVDSAFYLVHSMLPSAGLEQGSFQDFDLLLADNFSRAAEYNNLKQVIYLSGIINESKKLSVHLKSRLEVEDSLKNKSFSLTVFRSSLIISKDGSSFKILLNLIKNLPLLICPSWSRFKLTPIDIKDVIQNLKVSLLNEKYYNKRFEIGGPETLSYFELIKKTIEKSGKKRFLFRVPFHLNFISRYWIRLFSGAKKELIYPLLDSLENDMQVKVNSNIMIPITPLDRSLSEHTQFQSAQNFKSLKKFKKLKNVRSIQRLHFPAGKDITWVAKEYMNWLPKFLFPIFIITVSGNYVIFSVFSKKIKLLILKYSELRSSHDRQLFYIRGGLLAKKNPKGRLEFRKVLEGSNVISSIHDFTPRLPWMIYRYTQAIVHLFVMWAFGKHLNKVGRK